MRFLCLFVATLLTAACSIHQEVSPVIFAPTASREVCIVEHPPTRETFLAEYERVLQSRGFQTRVVPAGSPVDVCPIVTTYIARWSWDLTIYLSYVELEVYHNGRTAGGAVYDSRSGGGRLDKFIDAETKIAELVDQLFVVRR